MGLHAGRRRRPKIARSLKRPESALVLSQLRTARANGVAPTLFAGLRMVTTTYVYDDPEHPERVTSTIASPAYTVEDQGLMLALEDYENELCRCGQPRDVAWHSDMDGWFESESFVCHACSALRDDDEKTKYHVVRDTRPDSSAPLAPFVLGQTTTAA